MTKGPGPAALTLVIDDGLMPEKVGWVLGNPHNIEICGCAHDDSSAHRDLARDQRRIDEGADPKCHVDTFCDRVDVSVFKNQIDLESGIFSEERGQPRYYLKPRERHRRRNPQSARERRCGAARGQFCFLSFFDRSFGAFVEVSARLGWGQAMRRPQQQPHAQPLLKLRDRLGNGGLTDAELFCCAGERSGIDNAYERFHRSEPIHRLFPFGMNDITTARLPPGTTNEPRSSIPRVSPTGATCP